MSGTDFCMELAPVILPPVELSSRHTLSSTKCSRQSTKRGSFVLTKPVHPDELRAKVRAAAEDHKTRTENKRLLAMVKSLIENQAELTKQVIDLGGDPSAPDSDAQKTLRTYPVQESSVSG